MLVQFQFQFELLSCTAVCVLVHLRLLKRLEIYWGTMAELLVYLLFVCVGTSCRAADVRSLITTISTPHLAYHRRTSGCREIAEIE